jgi:hypothetical protein
MLTEAELDAIECRSRYDQQAENDVMALLTSLRGLMADHAYLRELVESLIDSAGITDYTIDHWQIIRIDGPEWAITHWDDEAKTRVLDAQGLTFIEAALLTYAWSDEEMGSCNGLSLRSPLS